MWAATTVATVGRHTLNATIQALLVLAIVVTLTLGLALVTGADPGGRSALAARGGGGGGGKPPRTTTTLVVTPNPAAAGGAVFTVTGSGYGADNMVAVALANPGCCVSWNVLADSGGNISFQGVTNLPGTYYVRTYAYGTTKLLGSTSFVVQ